MFETIFIVAIIVIEMVIIEFHYDDSCCIVNFNKDVFAEGSERNTVNGYKFCAYTGIPYATPPVGSNRFEVICRHLLVI